MWMKTSLTSTPMAAKNLNLQNELVESSKLKLKENQTLRENRRIRNSASFRIGVIITTSIQRPWRFLILPFSIMILGWNIIQERLGNKPVPYPLVENPELVNHSKRNDCIVLFPTNGVGFGHFTRMYGLAKRIRKNHHLLKLCFYNYAHAANTLQRRIPILSSSWTEKTQKHESS